MIYEQSSAGIGTNGKGKEKNSDPRSKKGAVRKADKGQREEVAEKRKKINRTGAKALIPVEKITERLIYNPVTGVFRWKTFPDKPKRIGDIAGRLCSLSNYWVIAIGPVRMQAHRVAWVCHYGRWPKSDIDHVNGNKTDNRIVNLRECNKSENVWNAKTPRHNSSGFKNVSFSKSNNKWEVIVKKHKKIYFGGNFENVLDAANSARILRTKLHGEYARHE